MKKITFLLLFLLFTIFSHQTYSQTYDLTAATTTSNTPTSVSEILSGVTMTVQTKNNSGNNITIATDPSFGTNQVAFHNSASTNTEEMIISFDAAVNVSSIRVISDITHSRTWTFTPTGGSNTAVDETGTFATSTDVTLDFVGVTTITITSDFTGGLQERMVFDQLTLALADVIAPTLDSSSPTDGASAIATSSNIVLTFDENIAFGTGNIQVIDITDASNSFTIDAASPGTQASISGAVLTINPSANLDDNSNYAIQIAATAIDDTSGNSYAGITNNTTLDFTTSVSTSFTALADLCIDAGVQAGLGGGTPTGGVYSGTGVTDNGNGMTYSFDPAAAGVGTHTITYTNGGVATDNVEVFALPTVTFTALADLCINAGVQAGLGSGDPTGGIYSGAGITDNGNGTTYSFDPAAAGVGIHTITYSFTNANGCSGSVSDNVEVFGLPFVTFTAPADLCINEGVQTGLGSGSPTGGVYSGTGITDNGNGTTYSFDPATAGVGIHTITYSFTNTNGCSGSASDNVEVFDLPTATFTAPADLCINAGVQAGLGSGIPTGGIYSGAGITDNGNGTTYSFNPAAAGAGTHTITYSFTNANGCTNAAADDIEVFALPTVTFTALADLCINAGVQAGLGSGNPTGGIYSGAGITDNGNGTTYSFDPAAAGVGIHTITYSFTNANGCSGSVSDNVEVFGLPFVTFTAPADLCIDEGVQAGLGSGSPTGGVYSGAGITDNGNGTTYSFDPATAGVGIHTITYSFTNVNGCSGSASDNVEVFDLPTATFTASADLCIDEGVQSGLGSGIPTGGVYSGTGITDNGNGMTYSFDPAAAGAGTHTITYSFTNANGCTNAAADDIEVFALPTVTFTALADLQDIAGIQTGLGGGLSTGGIYSGTGVTDDGNGMTYSFDPAAAGIGTHTITYSFTNANGCSGSASDAVAVSNLISPTVTFDNITKTYGDANFNLAATSNSGGTISYSIIGTGNGTSLFGTNNQTITLGNIGTVSIRATQTANGTFSSTTKDITLTINSAALTISVNAGQTKVYGTTDAVLAYTITDFVNGDTEADLDTPVNISRVAGENVGNYAITLSAAADANYTVNLVNNTYAISKATLTATADDKSRNYGEDNPEFTISYTGFVNGDTEVDLDTAPVASSTATNSTTAGTVSIDLSTGTDINYEIVNTNGTLTILADTTNSITINKKYGFSPNGDGINDTWLIDNIENYENNVVKVYNRSGKLVYEQKAYKNTWNGVANTIGGNQKLPVGPYLFIIELNNANEKPVQGWLYINY